MNNEIPRRSKLYENTREELQIRQCINAVENLGAHPLLTESIILLGQAKDRLSDWVDGDPRRYETGAEQAQ